MPPDPDLDAILEPAERELGERLERERPVPGAGFRGALGRRLAARDPGFGPRPPWLVATVCSSFGGGLLLIALSALSAAGRL